MKNLSKLVAFMVCLVGFITTTIAGQAMIFDNPGLIVYKDGNRIYGFYDAETKRFSCYFLFFQNSSGTLKSDVEGYSRISLMTFVPHDGASLIFESRDKFFDIRGALYRNESEWIIHTDQGQAGCENAAGGFIFEPSDLAASRFNVESSIDSIGVRMVKRKTYFFDRENSKFFKRSSYLTRMNSVVVIQNQGPYSQVRFSDPRLYAQSYGRVTVGWVRSDDLINPFPTAAGRD
ncbi:hypothetical protein WCQ02_21845 [Paraburkholderia tropica]|uniref:hypothetical protein n=1 Tax=Paraburkholderia tropica TaxID=92647 RepID=UPI0030169C95